ncbi:uncharacterized protein B0J16DRAFT_343225 [Fusarium flagelliforme]|uniref:uncharacterized protein n=1 Tax=Fusarium flagelliforme TaxID=2675880 RepID=UPI001E8CEDDF|nr:uncharacterized protein B0J16DRAFT_343225 [Fusarium flagelliforme]KAH7186116.1 hypothetical protein B0J16DRAFT_343225 [Fusarium flagelliforme]
MGHYDRIYSLSGMELAKMPNMYGPEETVGNEFAIHDTDIVFDSQCEPSRWLERLVTIPEEPSLASAPSLLPTQESQEIRYRSRKPQVGQRRAPKSARLKVKREGSTNNQRREMVAGNRDGSDINDELCIQNHRKKRQRQKRNLKAAKESRRRKEENLMRLQSDAQAIEDRYSMLSALVKSLKEEVLDLRTQLLQHTSCQCILIHRYMEREARRYVEDQILRSIML